jgi:hypothetical protein
MGYYVRGTGSFVIKEDDLGHAYDALCALNQQDSLKYGGSWGGSGVSQDDPRPEGMTYHPARWFSWLDANYPAKCPNLDAILSELGFDFSVTRNGDTLAYRLNYDSKIGQEDLFLEALAPFIQLGSIEWTGEDGVMWMNEFVSGSYETKRGRVVYE